MPVGVSSHYPGLSSPDMQVTISPPIIVGYSTGVGEPLPSAGQVYGPNNFVEIVYAVTSSASSTAIQASKAIDAEVGVYPKQLSIPRPN